MVDISAGYVAIKETLSLLKTINDAKTDYERRAATAEIQSKLLTLQSDSFSLMEAIRSREEDIALLKAKIAEFEDFISQTKGYVLNQLDSGTFVYSKNVTVNSNEVTVNLCPQCFSRKVISILQPTGEPTYDSHLNTYFHQSRCHGCDTTFSMNKSNYRPIEIAPMVF